MRLIDDYMIEHKLFPTYEELNCAATTTLMGDYIALWNISDKEYITNGPSDKYHYLYSVMSLYGGHIKKRL